jgi:hypothetical protein
MKNKGRHSVKTNRTTETIRPLGGEPALTRLQPLTKAEIDGRTKEVVRMIVETCSTDEVVHIRYLGRDMALRPLDTRRFVITMSRFLSLN